MKLDCPSCAVAVPILGVYWWCDYCGCDWSDDCDTDTGCDRVERVDEGQPQRCICGVYLVTAADGERAWLELADKPDGPLRLLVVAGSEAQARRWAREQELEPSSWTYATGERSVLGLSAQRWRHVVVGTWSPVTAATLAELVARGIPRWNGEALGSSSE